MEQNRFHVMVIEKTYPSGAEEWYCPACGRRLIMQWNPEYRRIILQSGEETILHTGSKAGVQVRSESIRFDERSGKVSTGPTKEIDRLAPWREWLDSHLKST